MQKLSVRLPRFDSSTGRRRSWLRGWPALAAGLALALVLGSGIAVAAVSTAQAHTPSVKSTCTELTVKAEYYAATGPQGQKNTMTITFNGQTDVFTFGSETITKVYPAPDPTKPYTYDVTVEPWNDPTNANPSWHLHSSGTSTVCNPPSIPKTSATVCNVVGGSTAITAQFGQLKTDGRSYTVTLASAGGTNYTQSDFKPTTTDNVAYPAGGAAATAWAGAIPGFVYTITITDNTDGHYTASTTVTSVGCPKDSSVSIDVVECAATNGAGSFTLNATVVDQRQYKVTVYKDAAVLETFSFTASSTSYSKSYTATPGSTYSFKIEDVAGGKTATSDSHKYLPCPVVPNKPSLVVTQCSSTVSSDAALAFSLSGLVPDRSYLITVVDGTAKVIFTETLVPATSSSWPTNPPKVLSALPPGSYTVTVADVTDPSTLRTALVTGFSASDSATIAPCPEQQDLTVDPTQCSVPGGSGAIVANLTDYVAGRTYVVSITENGLPVPGQPGPTDFVSNDPTTPAVQFSFTGLAPDKVYRIVVADKLVPTVIASADQALSACPGNPGGAIVQVVCSLFGDSKVTVDVNKLVAGQTYTVGFTVTSTGNAVPGVPDQQVPGTPSTASLVFSGLTNGQKYTLTVQNATKTLTASTTFTLPICDLPTFPLPPELPTLAYTGSSTTTPMLAGLGFLQLGVVLVGISLARRRSGASEV